MELAVPGVGVEGPAQSCCLRICWSRCEEPGQGLGRDGHVLEERDRPRRGPSSASGAARPRAEAQQPLALGPPGRLDRVGGEPCRPARSRSASRAARRATSSGSSPSNTTTRAASAASAIQSRGPAGRRGARLSVRQSSRSQAEGPTSRHRRRPPAASASRANGSSTTPCAAGIGTVRKVASVDQRQRPLRADDQAATGRCRRASPPSAGRSRRGSGRDRGIFRAIRSSCRCSRAATLADDDVP